METSNVKIQSNLYILKHGLIGRDDRNFLKQIVDPEGIRIMKADNAELTLEQIEIKDRIGRHCEFCVEGDFPWGMVKYYNKENNTTQNKIVCECEMTQCKEYSICRGKKYERPHNEEIEDAMTEHDNREYIWEYSLKKYQEMAPGEKLKQLLLYWRLTDGPVISFDIINSNNEAQVYSLSGKPLRNPFTGDWFVMNAGMFKNQKYIAFDINENCMGQNDLLSIEYLANKDYCIDAAREILHRHGLTIAEILNEGPMYTGARNNKMTASMIKKLHKNPKTKDQCRHAGCVEQATNNGYCFEHFLYHMAESK